MNCNICDKEADNNVPLLRCGHYICPDCYCTLKLKNINHCQICFKYLVRGIKKNIVYDI